MTIGRLLAASALCAPLLLAGCSDDPEPKIAPPTTPSTSATPSPGPTKEAWEEKSDDGAVAFAERWVEVFNAAQNDGDVSQLKALSAPGCGTCQGLADQLTSLYSDGGSLESDGWRILTSVPAEGLPSGEARISLRIQRTPQIVQYGDDREDERFGASKVTLSARLVWVGDGWTMNDLVGLQ